VPFWETTFAIKAYRAGRLPFPEGAIVGRIRMEPRSIEENNKSFGREQSFVAGAPTEFYLQFMVKDSKKVRRDWRVGVLVIRQGRQTKS